MLKTVRVPENLAPHFEQAQSYVTRYFADQRSRPERGTLEVCGQRYVLVRAASLSVEFHQMVGAFHGANDEAAAVARSLLFDIAHGMGLSDARAFAERMNLTDPIARLSAGPLHFAHAGWAFVDISPESVPSPDENYYLLYDHPYSFESDSWLAANESSDRPVCIMNAGYSSGWCEEAFGLPLVATEILCRARGDEACRFIMAPPGRIEEAIARYADRHPELRPRLVNHHVPGFFSTRTDEALVRTNLELEQRSLARARELVTINEALERDIAQRKRAETALSAAVELTDRLIEALPGGVVHVGADGAILRSNADARRILGLSYDELSQRYVADFGTETVHEDGSPALVSDFPVSRAIATGSPQPAVTLGVRKPNGEVSWGVYRAVPTRDPETGAITGAVVTFFDITERKRFEDKLRHAQKLESLGVLAGGVAHDFNNLLVAILGNASLAEQMPECDPKVAALLHEITLGARRAADLTKQMLDYAGQSPFERKRLEVPRVLRQMSQLVKALVPKHIELHTQVQEGLPAVEGDEAQLRQVVMNLLTNAAEALGEARGRVVVSVGQRYVGEAELEGYEGDAAPGKFVALEVRDDGCGMSAETAARAFEPFFTTKFTGRGLGMAAVLGIVRSHRGGIRLESVEGGGTSAVVLLPAAPGDGEETRSTEQGRLVLLVDDDDSVRAVARRMLVNAGYTVVTASNGAEALRMFERHAEGLELVVMDVTMPEMSGIEALRHIRESGSSVPVLMSSGYGTETAPSGAQGVLEKPYDSAQLLNAVADVLAGRRLTG